MTKPKYARTFRGLIVRPRSQLAFLLLMSAGFVVLAIFFVIVMTSFNSSIEELRRTFQLDTDTANLIMGDIMFYLRLGLTISVFFAASGALVALFLSNRVYGPAQNMLHHVRALTAGQTYSRLKLRTSDELQDLGQALNELAEKLDAGSGGSKKP